MQLNTKSVKLTDDSAILVCEAGANYDARYSQAMIEAEKCEDADKTFVFFYKTFYPILSACALGGLPTAKEAYLLNHKKLDEWYLAVWELNPELLGPLPVVHTEEVEFRDESRIVVYESHGLPSFLLRLVRLEEEAQAKTDVPADEVNFRNFVYPKIAACVNGSKIPDADEICTWPLMEIAKWSAVAMKLNPRWFNIILDESQKQEENKEELKKKSRRRAHHKPAESVVQKKV